MSISAVVVIDGVFHKILYTHEGFLTKTQIGNISVFIPLYLHRFNFFSLFFENLGTERTEGIIKLVAVVDMVLNFLITDKSIMAERSSVQSQVSKCSTTSAFSSKILVQKGQGMLGQFKDKSEVYEPNSQFSSLRCN